VSQQPSPLHPYQPQLDPQLVEMLAGLNATADMAVVQRTRLAVMEAAAEMREQRRRNRRTVGVILLTVAVLGMVLTPAIWSSVDDFFGGEQFLELPGMVMVMILLLFSTILGALVVGIRSQQQVRPGRR
jgi:hypothetical protein